MILAIDPGPAESAFVIYHGGMVVDHMKYGNNAICSMIQSSNPNGRITPQLVADHMVIECVASYGMAVGAEVFETCLWAGRFIQAWHSNHPDKWSKLYRKDVKMHLCGNMQARDSNIRAALIDRFGGTSAIGRKANPGPLYGISGDVWAALAVAVTYTDRAP